MSKRHQQVQQQPPTSSGNDSAPPFLPLEETMQQHETSESSLFDDIAMGDDDEAIQIIDIGHQAQTKTSVSISKKNDDDDDDNSSSNNKTQKKKGRNNNNSNNDNSNIFTTTFSAVSSRMKAPVDGKQLAFLILGIIFILILWELIFVEPKDRLIQPDFSDKFLIWVESNPGWGLGAILIVIALAVVSLVPIGTPLTIGCGYIYRGVYGWKLGLFVSTVISMAGSTLGAVTCFLLGRYLMRDTAKRWVRNYPLFDAIDIAVSEQGMKIMAMLYLTPVLPLGLVSYMCGTTAIDLYSFAVAKIASLPLYLMYAFMGASAHSFIKGGKGSKNDNNGDISQSAGAPEEAKKMEDNQVLLVSGLILSVIMMTLITRNIRMELMKVRTN
jgi:uncharacterized membrane protein YdjX (TVP38/TMEM64 family)